MSTKKQDGKRSGTPTTPKDVPNTSSKPQSSSSKCITSKTTSSKTIATTTSKTAHRTSKSTSSNSKDNTESQSASNKTSADPSKDASSDKSTKPADQRAAKVTPSTTKAAASTARAPPTTSQAPPTNKPSLCATVNRLKSDNPRKVLEALILIRKCFIKEKTGTDRLRHYGGVEALLSIIKGTNNKQKDIALSIMGNVCMDSKVQKKVLDVDGLLILGEVLTKSESTDIVNRSCRTLANLAQNPECCVAIHEIDGLIAACVDHLNKAEDENLQLTIIRTLRILSDTSSHRQTVIDEEGLRAVASMLKSESSPVIKATYQCLMVLTKKFSIHCARQIVAADGPASVIKLTSHENEEIKKVFFNLLLTDWMCHEEMRVGIGNAGGVTFFIDHLEKFTAPQKRLILANALCLSCYEVVNRVRVKDSDGLQIMLRLLHDSNFVPLHDRLISALACFLYDDVGFDILLQNGLVAVVISHLKRVAKIRNIPLEMEIPEERSQSDEIVEEKGETEQVEMICDESEDLSEVPNPMSETKEEQSEMPSTVSTENQKELDADTPKPDDDEESINEANIEEIKSECLDEMVDDSGESEKKDDSKPKTFQKYSIDSPTYKSVVEWQVEDYSQGPKNIHDSQLYYEQVGSPASLSGYSSPQHYGPYSPLSVSSYGSYDCSPENSPCPKVRSVSPNLTGSEAPTSPGTVSLSSGVYSEADSQAVSPALSLLDVSTVQDSPNRFTAPGSPEVFTEPASPLFISGTLPSGLDSEAAFAFYSSDEDDMSELEQETDSEFKALLSGPSTAKHRLLSLDSLSLPSTSSVLSTRLNSDTSDNETWDSKPMKRAKRSVSASGKKGEKRKRELTPEMRKKILLSVEKSNRGTSCTAINLTEMLTSNVSKLEPDVANKKECPTDKRDFRKQIEYYLIMLLKRISYGSDPSEYLIQTDVLATILDYVRLASEPFNKCGRILIRLTKNPQCFEKLLFEMMPALVHRKLKVLQHQADEKDSDKTPSTIVKSMSKDKGPHVESFPRSMSACTLEETSKAVSFHKKVLEQVASSPVRKELDENKKDSLNLKDSVFSNLALMAESPFGQGVIDHILKTGTLNMKCRAAVSLAFVCQSRPLLVKTFIEGKGLLPLFSAVKQEQSVFMQRNAVEAFSALIANHVKDPPPPTLPAPPATQASAISDPVVFTFSDGSKISAGRSILVEKSEVFSAMLEGHYSESKQSEVHLPDVSNESFQILVDYFHGVKKEGQQPTMDTLMEAFQLSHRFMLDDLVKMVAITLVEKHLSSETVEEICSQASLHGCKWLSMRCLLYVIDPQKNPKLGSEVVRKLLMDLGLEFLMDMFQ